MVLNTTVTALVVVLFLGEAQLVQIFSKCSKIGNSTVSKY